MVVLEYNSECLVRVSILAKLRRGDWRHTDPKEEIEYSKKHCGEQAQIQTHLRDGVSERSKIVQHTLSEDVPALKAEAETALYRTKALSSLQSGS